MRNFSDMAMIVSDSDRPSPKVWQPWYIDESDGIRKTLPTRVMREQRTRGRLILQKPTRRTLSPSHGIEEEIDVGGSNYAHQSYVGGYTYDCSEEPFEEDAPLDMSLKRRTPPAAHTPSPPLPPPAHRPAHSSHTPPAHTTHTSPPLQPPPAHTITSASGSPPPYSTWTPRGRPTVITCATPWYIPPPAHVLPPPPPYDVAAAHLREHRKVTFSAVEILSPPTPPMPSTTNLEGGRSSPESGTEAEPARRHVVQAGPVDPEIDEHFRRSLGRNYQDLFVNEHSSDQQHDSNDSVDDHFAKALGATWTKLKAEREKGPSASSTGTPAPTSQVTVSRVSSSPRSPAAHLATLPRGTSVVPSHTRTTSPGPHHSGVSTSVVLPNNSSTTVNSGRVDNQQPRVDCQLQRVDTYSSRLNTYVLPPPIKRPTLNRT